MNDTALISSNSQKPLDESSVDALERAFQDEIVDQKETESHNFKPIIYAILIVFFIIALGVTSLTIFYSNIGGDKNDDKIRLNNSSTFKPVLDSSSGKEYVGKLFSISEIPIGSNYSYQLLDDKGDTIVFIYSSSIDLSLAQGLTVGIRGIPDSEDSNGIKVINVKELEFK